MGKSIMQTDRACYFCGRLDGLERHHVLGGFSSNNRRLSETYGLWVYVCKKHHTDQKEGVQYNKEMNLKLKQDAQLAFQKYYGRSLWMQLFRKNYLGDWGKEDERCGRDQQLQPDGGTV